MALIYLVLVASTTSSGINLEAGYPTQVTTAPGVAFQNAFLAKTAASYGPATSTEGLGGDIELLVTTPEPGSSVLVGVGLAIFSQRRRFRHCGISGAGVPTRP